jgi:hypothetical protein
MDTSQQYEKAAAACKDIFIKKMQDYGTAWRVLRVSSITDQIFIKAQRVRSIEEKGQQRVLDGVLPEYIGIVNYSVIALIQLEAGSDQENEMPADRVTGFYDKFVKEAWQLMDDKNHDYDEAWRKMRVSSFTDLILMKLLRIKQIEDNQGQTIISEGVDANFHDIINYAMFAIIRLPEQNQSNQN